jgi:hypothetical protein
MTMKEGQLMAYVDFHGDSGLTVGAGTAGSEPRA